MVIGISGLGRSKMNIVTTATYPTNIAVTMKVAILRTKNLNCKTQSKFSTILKLKTKRLPV